MNIQIYCISFCIFIGTCSASKKVPDFNKYLEYKNRFDSTLTMHFPEYPLAENYIATLHTESKKIMFGLCLFILILVLIFMIQLVEYY